MRRTFALCAILLAACASTPEAPPPSTEDLQRRGLAAQPLAPGDCGLFVWRADAGKAFVLFSSADRAVVHIDEDISLSPSPRPFAPTQTFAGKGRDYALDLREPDPFEGGVRYPRGTLKTVSDEGWDVIVPVLGLSLCQPVASS